MADHIEDLGPACYWAQWTMERVCGIIKTKARSKSQMNASVMNGAVIKEHLHHAGFLGYDINISPNRDQNPNQLPQLLDEFKLQQTARKRRDHMRRLFQAVEWLQEYFPGGIENTYRLPLFRRCRYTKDMTIGSVDSQRRCDINRNNSRVVFRTSETEPCRFGEVQYFVSLSAFDLGDWAWIRNIESI